MNDAPSRHWVRTGELLVSFFCAGPVAGPAWAELCRAIAQPQTRAVVLASIGPMELDAASRSALGEALRVAPRPSLAVVTDEALVRGTMTAMSWQWPVQVKMFAWHKLREAHAYLAPAGVEAGELLELVEQVRREVEER